MTMMKKILALGLALVMSFALLAACTSADPNNPYDPEREPTPKVETESAK